MEDCDGIRVQLRYRGWVMPFLMLPVVYSELMLLPRCQRVFHSNARTGM
jgi:hypothetical protein